MKRLVIAFLILMCFGKSIAQDLHYTYDETNKTAGVTYYSNGTSGYNQGWNITSVVIPEKTYKYSSEEYTVNRISYNAFMNCYNLTSVTMPNTIVVIAQEAFRNCWKLSSITLSDNITSIGSNVFDACTSLKSINIPKSLTSIGNYAFGSPINIKDIYVENLGNWCKISGLQNLMGNSYDQNERHLYLNNQLADKITLPNEITSITSYAFHNCTSIKEITIPRNITQIGAYSFYGCKNLESVTNLSTTPQNIDTNTFSIYQTLRVPILSKAQYQESSNWNNFKTIIGLCDITAQPDDIIKGNVSGSGMYDENSNVSLVATPNIGYEFVRWSDGSTENPYVFKATADKSLTAEFKSEPIKLSDGSPYNRSTNENSKELRYTRTFNNTDWQALYVPFQMSYSDWCDDFEVAKINNFHQFDTDNDDEFDDLRMEIIKVKSGTLKQNHPYLIKAKTTGEKTIALSNATLYAAEENAFVCNSMETTYTFTGTYAGVSGEEMYNEKHYSMGGGSLILAEDATANLKPYRWYLKMEGRDGQVIPTPSSVRVMVWDGETSSIETLSFDNASTPLYSVDGRMVENSKAKGLYIINGKKVLR